MKSTSTFDYLQFFERQLEQWQEVADKYAKLATWKHKTITIDDNEIEIRFNPERIHSSTAKTDADSVAKRKCFLCKANRPSQQMSADFGDFELLVNPYPIFSRHFTIAAKAHTPQVISGNLHQMLEFAKLLDGLTVFYNGAQCGASAPDHLHFQAVPTSELPMWKVLDSGKRWIVDTLSASGSDITNVVQEAEGLLWHLKQGNEANVNIYSRYSQNSYQIVIIPRSSHRPSCYGSGTDECLISPASAEMAGSIVAPRAEDFEFALKNSEKILHEVGCHNTSTPEERTLNVGITKAQHLEVTLNGDFKLNGTIQPNGSLLKLNCSNNCIICNGSVFNELELTPTDFKSCSFTLSNVMIGIGFHWQQHEDQSFHGCLKIICNNNELIAINRVKLETYLRSVVSSEMNANAPEEFLKAHAVISRSWVMAQVMPPAHLNDHTFTNTPKELIKWYDRDAHTLFDICADDHCQRYQGCTKASTPQVDAALKATRGEVLAYDYDLCDARFSKCCGGKTELFSTCWQNVDLPYLQAVDDPYCSRATNEILSTVLNNYDQTTTDYYRWSVEYTAQELSQIIANRSGIDFGSILELNPLHRGASNRIDKLEIVGTKRTRIIGKELEIRRTLSNSHLYSSAFTVQALDPDSNGIPSRWILSGYGWGHGVGLCQIGAAVMASEGYNYREILNHYFPGAKLITIY